MNKQRVTLRYDGKYVGMESLMGDSRQWTILSDYYDMNGCNRKRGSFHLSGLVEIGAVPFKIKGGN